ncbi:murein biosynthesis integral membrane protein MurJ [Helicobacter sp. MIT 14-3879]|uniref:murein biosynthesis integral membrane protein MurJ n=1 Tax=Helicobacter sp. MIT 14-3879 TaxID=2040649 RepID=UPI000E1E5D4F|nr:murein biosynthesis integral membrane protein MurJ [Helicobacter sp. MIT 14-3879]RDU61431.1 lipid II flippase MurJ [Helicobacter sp. MIT 14-3879]
MCKKKPQDKDMKKVLAKANLTTRYSTKKNKLAHFFFTNASGIFISRIFGFLRDAMQASILGTSIYSDIFFIAFKFPNMFRRVVSEGAFVQSFLPFFLGARNKGAFSVSIFSIFLFLLLVLTGLVLWCAPLITKILALGYDSSRISLALPLVKIHFWYLLLIFIVTYLSTLLQYKQIFWVNAYNTVLLNLAMIFAMIFIKTTQKDLLEAVYILSYSVLIGGGCQILIHFYPLYTSKIWYLQYIGFMRLRQWNKFARLQFQIYKICSTKRDSDVIGESKSSKISQLTQDSTPCNYSAYIKAKRNILQLFHDIKIFFKAFLPAMLGASSAQIIAIIDSSLVTLLPNSDGGVSVLNFANRVFQLPLALFAIATSSALFPTVAKAIKRGDSKETLQNLKTAFWFLAITLSLCVLGGIMLRNEIIWLIFERGNFTRTDTIMVGYAFIGYMLGLLPFGLVKIFSLWLYANKQQAKAAKFSVISLLIGTTLAGGFILTMRYMEITDGVFWELRYFFIALAGSVGGFILLFLTLKEFGISNFLAIIKHKKYIVLLIVLLCATSIMLKIFTYFISIE